MKDKNSQHMQDKASLPPRGSEGPGGAATHAKTKQDEQAAAEKQTSSKIPEVWPGGNKPKDAAASRSKKLRSKGKSKEGGSYFGLRSKSELLYPTAYAPIDAAFWEGLSDSQQQEIMKLQAIAQEKVGFEKSTPKYFISGFRPGEQSTPAALAEADLVSLAAPRFILGGALLGSGSLSVLLALTGYLPLGPVGITGTISLLVGLVLCINARN